MALWRHRAPLSTSHFCSSSRGVVLGPGWVTDHRASQAAYTRDRRSENKMLPTVMRKVRGVRATRWNYRRGLLLGQAGRLRGGRTPLHDVEGRRAEPARRQPFRRASVRCTAYFRPHGWQRRPRRHSPDGDAHRLAWPATSRCPSPRPLRAGGKKHPVTTRARNSTRAPNSCARTPPIEWPTTMSPGAIIGARNATASPCRIGSAGARTSPKRPRPARTPSQSLGVRPSPCRQMTRARHRCAIAIAVSGDHCAQSHVARRHRGEARARPVAHAGVETNALYCLMGRRAKVTTSCERTNHPC